MIDDIYKHVLPLEDIQHLVKYAVDIMPNEPGDVTGACVLKRALGGCGTGHVHAVVQELLRFRHVVLRGRIDQLRGEGDHDFSTMRERVEWARGE